MISALDVGVGHADQRMRERGAIGTVGTEDGQCLGEAGERALMVTRRTAGVGQVVERQGVVVVGLAEGAALDVGSLLEQGRGRVDILVLLHLEHREVVEGAGQPWMIVTQP